MDISRQIKEICNESNNTWFLNHNTKIALYDLECDYKSQEPERTKNIAKILNNHKGSVYDFESERYNDDHFWIIPDHINGEIPGFMLYQYADFEEFTYELNFALVRKKYRKKGILKEMVNKLPKDGDIWLEASSNEIDNVENIWEKCGFSFHKTINYFGDILIYKRLGT
jgi:hypothetical protein